MFEENSEVIVTGDEDEFGEYLERGFYRSTVTCAGRYADEAGDAGMIYPDVSSVFSYFFGGQEDVYVLDVGSSSGEAVYDLVERLGADFDGNLHPIALDVSGEMLDRCAQLENAAAVRGIGQEIPLEDDSIDVIVSNQLLLRDEDIEEVVEEMNRVLKPGGVARLATGYELEETDYRGVHLGRIE